MTNEIVNLENSPKISLFGAIIDGINAIFSNFGVFIKMQYPILFVLMSLMVSVSVMYIPYTVPFGLYLCFLMVSITGVVFFAISFWQYLLGLVGVSYLAKDIFENKEIKNSSVYIGYAKEHTKSYVGLLLWICLFYIILWVIGIFLNPPVLNIIAGILTIPLCMALAFAPVFWAYQDKNKPLLPIIDAIKKSYSNLKFLGFVIISYIVNALFIILSFVIGIFAFALKYFTLFNDPSGEKLEHFLSVAENMPIEEIIMLFELHLDKVRSLILFLLFLLFIVFAIYLLMSYVGSFIFTRVYFELYKKD